MSLSARMPDLEGLQVLVRVSAAGSLSAAARELGMTQQAVSARVASLEAQVGVPLIVRSTRGSELTAAGRIATDWADRLLLLAHEVDNELAVLRERSRTRVRVAATPTVSEQLLPGWLLSFHADTRRRAVPAPQVMLTAADTGHVLELVRGGTADLGFIEGPGSPRGFRSRFMTRLDARRDVHAVWLGSRVPPAGAVRDLLGHINSVPTQFPPGVVTRGQAGSQPIRRPGRC